MFFKKESRDAQNVPCFILKDLGALGDDRLVFFLLIVCVFAIVAVCGREMQQHPEVMM